MYIGKTLRLAALLMGSTLLFGSGGCASEPVEMSPQATESLGTMRSLLFTGKGQVQEAANAAKDLVDEPRSDLNPQIKRLNSAVASLNATRSEAKSTSDAQNVMSEQYFAKWEAQLKTMSEDTAWRGKKRLEEARESTEKLRKDADDIRAELNPFMGELNEATKYMATDTTKAGLDVVKPKLKSAIDREPKVDKAIDKAISDIDAIRSGK